MNSLLVEALRLWKDGWQVLPILPGTQKRPLWKYKPYRKPTEAKVRKTWGGDAPPDLGVVLPPGVVVADADSPAFIDALEPQLKETYCTYTTLKSRDGQERRGLHAWYTDVTDPLPGGRKAWRPVPKGLDIKGPGTVVIVPPSRGGRAVASSLPMQSVKNIRPFVEGLVREVGEEPRERMVSDLLTPGRKLTEGERNDGLLSYSGVLRKAGFAGDRLLAALRGLNIDMCLPPLPDEEVVGLAESASSYIPSPFESRTYDMQLVTGEEKVPPVTFNVEQVWPSEAVTYIYGREKTGKSYVCMSITMAMVLGMPWVDLAVRHGPIIYVDFERRGQVFIRRWQAMARGLGLTKTPPVVYVQPTVALPDFVDDLRSLIYTHDAIGWLLDSFTISLTGADVTKEHHKVIGALNELKHLPAPGLVVDHTRKLQPGENPNIATGGFGSTFKQAVPSMIWRLKKASEGFQEGGFDFTLEHENNNFDLNPPDIHVRVELGLKNDSIHIVTLERQEKEAVGTVISWHMSSMPKPQGEGWTIDELALDTGQGREAIRAALDAWERVGKVQVHHGRGRGNKNQYFWIEME